MKFNLSVLVLLFLTMFSCNNADDNIQSSDNLDYGKSILTTNRYYGVKTSKENNLKGVAQKDNLWYNGTTLTVSFLNDPYGKSSFIKDVVKDLEEYVNIKFDFVNSNEDAIIRVGFDWNDSRWVTWSYTGSNAKYVRDKNEATVNFGSWDVLDSDMQRGDVLRAFCQVLGLELEHRHLNFDAGFTNRVQSYWEGEINDIPWSELQEYVFTPLDTRNIIQTEEYDPLSIMIWPFDRRVALNTSRDWNLDLSNTDKEFLKQLYPKDPNEITDIINIDRANMASASYIQINIKTLDQITVDWSDGIIDTINASNEIQYIRHSSESRILNTKIRGTKESVTYLSLDNQIITAIDVKNCLNLEYLSVSYNRYLTSLDISKNSNLWNLGFAETKISSIDISNCPALTHISAQSAPISSINTKNNLELLYLMLTSTNVSSVDLSNNPKLRTLGIRATPLAKSEEGFDNVANQLPNRVGQSQGSVDFNGSTTNLPENVKEITKSKNWATGQL